MVSWQPGPGQSRRKKKRSPASKARSDRRLQEWRDRVDARGQPNRLKIEQRKLTTPQLPGKGVRPSRLFGFSGVEEGQKESGFGSQPSPSDQLVLERGTPLGVLLGREMGEGETVFASNSNQTSMLQQSLLTQVTPNSWNSPVSLPLHHTGWSYPPLPPVTGVTWSLPPTPGSPTAGGHLPAAGALMRCTSCWAWGPLTPV